MQNTLEYLSREEIELTSAIVTENKLKVCNDCALYVNLERVEKIDIKELLKTYSNITKTAKERKIKLSYQNKIKSQLAEMKKLGSYEEAYQNYTNKFNQLVELWDLKLKEGLHMGTSDDVILNNLIFPIQHEIISMFYVGTVLSKVNEIKRKLDDLEADLKYGTEFIKIFL